MCSFNNTELFHAQINDVVAPKLKVLFCGINPGLLTAETGHHFARPGNRFWPALYAGGFTPRLLQPSEQLQLLNLGYGLTNVVPRTTVSAAELTHVEIRAGGRQLARKLERYQPKVVAILGIGTYKTAFGIKTASLGLQPVPIAQTPIWLLPNPSGLNAHYTPKDFAVLFAELKQFSDSLE